MADVTARLTYGRINLKRQSQRLAVFKVTPPFNTDSGTNSGRRINVHPSVQATSYPDGGGFSTHAVAHAEGTVILLQASRTNNACPAADGWVFIRLRESGPKLQVFLNLVTGPESVLGDRLVVFSGNGDVLAREELDVLGFHLPGRKAENYLKAEEVDELFTAVEISPGTASRPSYVRIATAKGVEVKAVAAEPIRRMRIRR